MKRPNLNKIDIRVLIATGILLGLTLISSLVYATYYLFTLPLPFKDVEMSAGTVVCEDGNFFLPFIYKQESDDITIRFDRDLKIFEDLSIYSSRVCVFQKRLLGEGSNHAVKIEPAGIGHLSQVLGVSIEEYSKTIEDPEIGISGVNPTQSIDLELSVPNYVFNYVIWVDGKQAECESSMYKVKCPLESLKLEQGNVYSYDIYSKYKDLKIEKVGNGKVKIKEPVLVTNNSLEGTSQLFDLTPAFNIETSKDILEVEDIVIKRSDSDEQVKFESKHAGKLIEINVISDLSKNSSYHLSIKNIVAIDGSFLPAEYTYDFKTADGPHATSSNLTSKFNMYSNIVLYFDQNLKKDQELKNFVTLSPQRDFTYYISGNSIVIDPTTPLGFCESGSVNIKQGLAGLEELTSSQGGVFSYKTNCVQISSIGTSVEGRPLTSYTFGSGSKTIVFYGAMHGSESNTRTLLNYWVSELESNANLIPADKKVIVIPSLNPDGVAKNSRFNARGVDLNRNFGSSDWKSETYFRSKSYPTGGGVTPFSEPETLALRNFLGAYRPYLTLSYHSYASYVVSNGTSFSNSYGIAYSSLSGYQFIGSTGQEDAFEYSITGSFGQWALESGFNTLTVELATYSSSETARNFPAMWHMVRN